MADAAEAQSSLQTYSISIKSQELGSALNQLARATGVQVVFRPDLVQGRRAPALSGAKTPEQALAALLSGTGLTYRASGPNSFVLAEAHTADGSALPGVGRAAEDDQTIVVTGSSIRGVAAVGSNLVAVGQQEIEALSAVNMTQVVNSVPAITNTGSAPQGENAVGYYSPQIHALGASASNTTLVIIDGMRMVGGGTQYAQTDPNILPTPAIQRVEVLADGASSVYGSDAVAGVVNFFNRRRFEGLQVTTRLGFGRDYRQEEASILAGTRWERGAVYVAAGHVWGAAILNKDRPRYAMGDFRPAGGSNMQSYNCSPATLRTAVTGASRIYLSPSATTAVAQAQDDAPCNLSIYGTTIPENQRDNALVRATLDLTDRLTWTGTAIYSRLQGERPTAPGTLSNAAVFGPGSGKGAQINPFFVAPAGEPGAPMETINWANLLAAQPTTTAGNATVQLYNVAEYNFGGDWIGAWSTGYGWSRSFLETDNDFCQSCALLALNGTVQLSGAYAASTIPSVIVTQALTPANALDVWNPAETNRTSPATIRSLFANDTSNVHINRLIQTRLEVQGPLVELPAGPLRMATGVEFQKANQNVRSLGQSLVGPGDGAANAIRFDLTRDVYSGYVEFNAPLVRRLDLSLSLRYDKYSDVGATTNPKVAVNWRPADWLKLRGNWATAFVAPPLAAIGDPAQGYMRTANGAQVAVLTTIPIAFFPSVQQIPGADCSRVVSCVVGMAANPGITRGFGGGLLNIKASTGDSWSAGGDFDLRRFIPGLSANLTYFHNKFRGGANAPSQPQVLNTPGLTDRVTICPTGCTQAQVDAFTRVNFGARVSTVIPQTVYFMIDTSQGNVLNIDLAGVDYQFAWRLPKGRAGVFRVSTSGTLYTQFDQSAGAGAYFSTLGTSGFNTQFPSLELRTRTNLGWDFGDLRADVFVSYTPSYRNWSATSVSPVLTDANGPVGGGDKVSSDLVTDLTLAYELRGIGKGGSVYLNVQNIFDADPPFYNGATAVGPTFAGSTAGYNGLVSNPIGRVVAVGFRGRF